jgi:hypothetical protein
MPGAPPVTSPPAKLRRSGPLPCSALYGRRAPRVSAFPVLSLSGPASGPRRPGVSRALPGRAGSPGRPSSLVRFRKLFYFYLFHKIDARFKNLYLLINRSKQCGYNFVGFLVMSSLFRKYNMWYVGK